ncbi:MAG TPA: hypothetical protein VFL59_01740 [Candidatus Nanopelagicales bacterium]|nr:hypothetical protein [Candidatus Nanopelagicales bacterium]
MSATEWLVLVVIVLIVILGLLWFWTRSRDRQALRERFGPEYDRAVESAGSQSQAERELRQREERHDALQIHPLTSEQRERYSRTWDGVQAQFVDDPVGALAGAQTLVQQVMADRGYPTGDPRQQAADLSVEHADVLHHYRDARAVQIGPATTTEQLREAMVHYRALFASLLASDASTADPGPRRAR